MKTVARTLALLVFSSVSAVAQTRGATISGVVLDSTKQPVAGADVVARPGEHRTQSDSTGRFIISGLDGGSYIVVARKVGYGPDRWDVKLADDGKVDVRFALGKRAMQLDTVVVAARGECPPHTLAGFSCRRHYGGGVFLDYPDIDESGARETAELFGQIPGFRVEILPVQGIPTRVARLSNRSGCISALVDGRPASPANIVPRFAADVVALEVYLKPDSVPEVYQRHTWPGAGASRTGRCALVVYWTIWAPIGG